MLSSFRRRKLYKKPTTITKMIWSEIFNLIQTLTNVKGQKSYHDDEYLLIRSNRLTKHETIVVSFLFWCFSLERFLNNIIHDISFKIGLISLCGLVGSALDNRSRSPEFESRRGHTWRVFHLWLRFIIFGGRLPHLAYRLRKTGYKLLIINQSSSCWCLISEPRTNVYHTSRLVLPLRQQ